MTAKEYLKQISLLEAIYQTKLEEVNDLRLIATSTGAIRYDKDNVDTSPDGDRMINAIIKIIEAENKAMKAAVELAQTKQTITEQIIGLNEENAIRILCMRYIKHKHFEEIAEELHYTSQWTRELHIKALKLFEQTYPEILQTTNTNQQKAMV